MADKPSSEGLKSAADTTKQIITLSTGVIALTVTFLEKVVQTTASGAGTRSVPWSMFVAWILFGVAILAAVATLGAITGTLDALDRKQNGLTLNDSQTQAIEDLANGSNVKTPALVMSATFILAMGFTIATGFLLMH
ncbi:hypothetical protein [Bradyrhizobium prioriisuperbiae]|uniref:hypothetical protein n=1 Tax=Bradyrhizobium prioriisuperbiae TaxID=2854389 RepID=UPI0028E2F3A0|nr:hypothetical protein [Bradyrhizobium prioritasuperba]